MNQFLQIISIAAVPMLFAITLHEAAHGYIASKLGDKTALMMGRVTLNPIKHIDPIGTILLPMVMFYLGGIIFGWAKPVPVNWQNLNNPKRDAALVAAAGPFSNLIMALIWALIAKLTVISNGDIFPSELLFTNIPAILYAMAKFGIMINSALMLLNLIPIPPLDGSRVVSSVLPAKISVYYNSIEPYGIWVLLGLLVVGVLQKILLPAIQYLTGFITLLFGI